VLIVRDGYRVTRFILTEDLLCPRCGLACPGVFDPAPGSWGGSRQVVSIRAEDHREWAPAPI
jgi:pyruvate formate lyase activating enzyme